MNIRNIVAVAAAAVLYTNLANAPTFDVRHTNTLHGEKK